MKPPAPRNREYDVRRSRARSEFEVTLVLERVIRNRHDLALDQNLARCGLLAPIAHHSVPEGFADVEEKLGAVSTDILHFRARVLAVYGLGMFMGNL